MKVSVIIATLNRRALLTQCLRSLFDQTLRDFEVIVVDGGSTDGTGEVAQQYPIKFMCQNGSSQPSARNYGIMHSAGDILVFVDDDILADKYWLGFIVENFNQSEICGVGGRILISGINEGPSPVRKLSPYLKLRNRVFSVICENKLGETGLVLRSGYVTPNLDKLTRGGIEVQTFQGSSMAFRRSVFEAIGLFDESYVRSAFRTETEFCLRAFDHGFRLIYAPEAVVYHQVHEAHVSWAEGTTLGRTLFYNFYNNFLFVMRGRKKISQFSWIRFILVQVLAAEECLRLAVRRKKLSYLFGPMGALVALRSWIADSDNLRRGRIPSL